MTGNRIPTVEEQITNLESEIEVLEKQMHELGDKASNLQSKIYDLKALSVSQGLLDYCMDPENAYSFVITFAPHLDYHCELITVYRVLSIETDSWGPQYKCVVTKLHLFDGDMYCKSNVEILSGRTLLYSMQTNETLLTNKETAVDELLLKMLNCCPTVTTYKDYKSLVLDKDCRTYGVCDQPIGRY